jgi:hypothetical protein
LAYRGKCSRCGREYFAGHREVVVCDCWRYCPLCRAEMMPYAPDLAMNTYGFDDRRDLCVLRVCIRHFPYFFSVLKPVEIELERYG